MNKITVGLAFSLLCLSIQNTVQAQKKTAGPELLKNQALTDIQSKYEVYRKTALQIWDYAEMGYKEEKSSMLLQQTLSDNGFAVEKGVAGMPTAFVATYGSGQPVIAILAEYDALPGLSQQAVPEKKIIPNQAAGHGCGHHLFGTASVAAGIEIKQLIQQKKLSGTIRVSFDFGTNSNFGSLSKAVKSLFA